MKREDSELGGVTEYGVVVKLVLEARDLVKAGQEDEDGATRVSQGGGGLRVGAALTLVLHASTGLLTDRAALAESCRANRGPAKGPLFLMNHWVTRSNGISYAEDSAIVNTKAAIIARANACKAARGKMPTILAVNNVELGDVVGAAKKLNGLG